MLADTGLVYAAAGDRRAGEQVMADTAHAFEWLDKAYRDRSDLLVYLKVDPRLDPIRSDRRFMELVERVGIP